MRHLLVRLLAAVFTAGVMSCGTSNPQPLTTDELRGVIPELEAEVSADPRNPELLEQLGVAYFALGDREKAIEPLQQVLEIEPARMTAGLALGKIYEESGNTTAAQGIYQNMFPETKEERQLIEAAKLRATQTELANEMKLLAAREEGLALEPRSLAIMDFESPDGALSSIGKAVGAILTTEFRRLNMKLVERSKLKTLEAELEMASPQIEVGNNDGPPPLPNFAPITETLGIQQRLAYLRPSPDEPPFYTGALDGIAGGGTKAAIRRFQSWAGLTADGIAGPTTRTVLQDEIIQTQRQRTPVSQVDRRTAPSPGKLLGAENILGGKVIDNDDMLQANGAVVASRTGNAVWNFEVQTPRDDFFKMPGQIVLQTVEALSISISGDDRRRLEDLPPATRSMAAFLAFGEAVDHEERGNFDAARSSYQQALKLDSGFSLARDRVEVLSVGTQGFNQSIQRTLRNVRSRLGRSPRSAMSQALGAVGTGVEEAETREDTMEGRSPQADGPPTGTTRVRGEIPVGGGN